jgi:glycosyltransferase involved in cell wall biosynthesis
MKIAYLTHYDAHNINHWSGTGYHMGQAMQSAGCEVDYLGPLTKCGSWVRTIKWKLYQQILHRTYMGEVDPLLTWSYGRQATRKVTASGADVVLAPHPTPVGGLRTTTPIAMWADCTFGGMVNFYADYTGLCAESLRAGHAVEAAALRRCQMVIMASEWAAQTARDIYGVPAERLRVVPYGANIQVKRTRADIERLVAARPALPCRLLFIGRIWQRKNGVLALAVAEALNAAGLPTELTLVGSQPPPGTPLPPWVKPLGFVDKSKPEGSALLDRLLAEAHFLIVPSRAEAFGIAFCEASSFGVPSLTTRVGGIPSVVRNDANGCGFSVDAPPGEYRDYVLGLMRDYPRYQALARSSFHEYETRLNWDTASRTVKALLQNLAKA